MIGTDPSPVWVAAPPVLTGDLDEDAAALAAFTEAGAAHLATLPVRTERDGRQRDLADAVHTACRAARHAFLARHVDAVYDRLTEGRTRYPRLPELVSGAVEAFPGLVPSAERLAAERRLPQAAKEGLEIDQGIFCAAVLGSPVAGPHLVDAMLRPTPRALELLDTFRATGRVELDSVLVERNGPAAEVTFRNAHCLNAETLGLITDLETAVDLVLLDDQVRVGVLRGGVVDHPKYRGRRVFSAGINLKDLQRGAIPFVEFLMGRELGYINKMYRGLLVDPAARTWSDRTVAKPWLGAVDTFAIGGGMQLLLVLDKVIAETGAYFSLPAAEEGIVPGLGNLRLTRLTGARLARRVILGGQRIPADSADGALVCDEVVPAEEMRAAIDRAVRELSAPAVPANRRMLVLAEEPLDLYREYLAEFAATQAVRAHSEDVVGKVESRWRAGAVA